MKSIEYIMIKEDIFVDRLIMKITSESHFDELLNDVDLIACKKIR